MSTNLRSRIPDLSWLRPPKADPDGRMALVDHLREVRYRLVVSAAAICLVMIVAWFFYLPLLHIVMWPLDQAIRNLAVTRPDLEIRVSLEGVSSSFLMQMKVSAMAGVIIACPVWMYQIWAFIVPGLLDNERREAKIFLSASIPLFLAGITVGYFIMPKGYQVMLGFVPKDSNALSLLEANTFIANEMKLLLVFGASFLLPVLLVMLNKVGVLRGEQLSKARTPAIFGCFVFGAVATPSTDPFSMTAMALPMALLYYIAERICVRNDRRKAERGDLVLSDD